MADLIEQQKKLEQKVLAEINAGHPYEASQLAISFVARKKKSLGLNGTSATVFHAAKLLTSNNAAADAGILLKWFIEDGAGDDYIFHMEDGTLSANNYCDIQRLLDLLTAAKRDAAAIVVEQIYGPVHVAKAKKNVQSSALSKRFESLEKLMADLFEESKNWLSAYKSVVRLGDMPRLSKLLEAWAAQGHESEKPLFFGRAVMQLLSEGQIIKANQFLSVSKNLIKEEDTSSKAANLAVWHLSIILAELAALEPHPRVDKPKIFGIARQRYEYLLEAIDPKLNQLLEKIGAACYGVKPNQQSGPNPMALLQTMFGGAPEPEQAVTSNNKKQQQPKLNMNEIMAMIKSMEGATKSKG